MMSELTSFKSNLKTHGLMNKEKFKSYLVDLFRKEKSMLRLSQNASNMLKNESSQELKIEDVKENIKIERKILFNKPRMENFVSGNFNTSRKEELIDELLETLTRFEIVYPVKNDEYLIPYMLAKSMEEQVELKKYIKNNNIIFERQYKFGFLSVNMMQRVLARMINESHIVDNFGTRWRISVIKKYSDAILLQFTISKDKPSVVAFIGEGNLLSGEKGLTLSQTQSLISVCICNKEQENFSFDDISPQILSCSINLLEKIHYIILSVSNKCFHISEITMPCSEPTCMERIFYSSLLKSLKKGQVEVQCNAKHEAIGIERIAPEMFFYFLMIPPNSTLETNLIFSEEEYKKQLDKSDPFEINMSISSMDEKEFGYESLKSSKGFYLEGVNKLNILFRKASAKSIKTYNNFYRNTYLLKSIRDLHIQSPLEDQFHYFSKIFGIHFEELAFNKIKKIVPELFDYQPTKTQQKTFDFESVEKPNTNTERKRFSMEKIKEMQKQDKKNLIEIIPSLVMEDISNGFILRDVLCKNKLSQIIKVDENPAHIVVASHLASSLYFLQDCQIILTALSSYSIILFPSPENFKNGLFYNLFLFHKFFFYFYFKIYFFKNFFFFLFIFFFHFFHFSFLYLKGHFLKICDVSHGECASFLKRKVWNRNISSLSNLKTLFIDSKNSPFLTLKEQLLRNSEREGMTKSSSVTMEKSSKVVSHSHFNWEWMAPEILREDPFDGKVDVYSFGVIMYELKTGNTPFNDFEKNFNFPENLRNCNFFFYFFSIYYYYFFSLFLIN